MDENFLLSTCDFLEIPNLSNFSEVDLGVDFSGVDACEDIINYIVGENPCETPETPAEIPVTSGVVSFVVAEKPCETPETSVEVPDTLGDKLEVFDFYKKYGNTYFFDKGVNHQGYNLKSKDNRKKNSSQKR